MYYRSALDATGMRSLYSGLVASYSFEEPAGVTVVDGTGLGHTAGLNAVTRTVDGHDGAALQFKGGAGMVYTGMAYGITTSGRRRCGSNVARRARARTRCCRRR